MVKGDTITLGQRVPFVLLARTRCRDLQDAYGRRRAVGTDVHLNRNVRHVDLCLIGLGRKWHVPVIAFDRRPARSIRSGRRSRDRLRSSCPVRIRESPYRRRARAVGGRDAAGVGVGVAGNDCVPGQVDWFVRIGLLGEHLARLSGRGCGRRRFARCRPWRRRWLGVGLRLGRGGWGRGRLVSDDVDLLGGRRARTGCSASLREATGRVRSP